MLPSIPLSGGHDTLLSHFSFKSAKSPSTQFLKTGCLKMTLESSANSSPQLVAVVGATGGVGRLAVAACMQLGVKIKAVVRDEKKAASLLPQVRYV